MDDLPLGSDEANVFVDDTIPPGFPTVANLDGDPDPEVLITHINGLTLLENDGSITLDGVNPTGKTAFAGWFRPSAVHDVNGDGVADFATGSVDNANAFRSNATLLWSAPVVDESGWGGSAGFDFFGDGTYETLYADENAAFVFDATGTPVVEIARSSRTLIELPVVADVDNDGSAEIIVVSSADFDGMQTAPTIQVIGDASNRWVGARRIWNQHTYHVTNVREDGTIPMNETPSWTQLNTFRTNAQIEGGGICAPDPAG